jgi:hypothetical protein
MSENGRERVEPTHREAVEHYRELERQGQDLVKAMFREALERERGEKEQERALVEQVHREAVAKFREQPPPKLEPTTIPYTELPEAEPDSPLYREWSYYRREVGRLLAEGHEGRFLLIKGEQVIGIWDTQEEAKAVALQKYLMQPCLIHQIRSREPLLRGPSRLRRCLG